MKKPLIIANWKLHPATSREAVQLATVTEQCAASLRGIEVIVAPPFPFLASVKAVLKTVRLGAQDAWWDSVGPYTGAVSWAQLKSEGVRSIIVGHSERRDQFGESDELINKKIRALLENDCQPILCIGERSREGDDIPAIVGEQLAAALAGLKKALLKNLIVAYEPVWAISTVPGSRPDTPDNAFRARMYIRKILVDLYGAAAAKEIPIIYGGSVSAKNIGSFLKEGEMEGALVGGVSIKLDEMSALLKIAASTI